MLSLHDALPVLLLGEGRRGFRRRGECGGVTGCASRGLIPSLSRANIDLEAIDYLIGGRAEDGLAGLAPITQDDARPRRRRKAGERQARASVWTTLEIGRAHV